MLCLSSHKNVIILSVCCLLFCFLSCTKEVEVFKATESTVKETVDERIKDKNWENEIESPKDYALDISEISAPLPAACLQGIFIRSIKISARLIYRGLSISF